MSLTVSPLKKTGKKFPSFKVSICQRNVKSVCLFRKFMREIICTLMLLKSETFTIHYFTWFYYITDFICCKYTIWHINMSVLFHYIQCIRRKFFKNQKWEWLSKYLTNNILYDIIVMFKNLQLFSFKHRGKAVVIFKIRKEV